MHTGLGLALGAALIAFSLAVSWAHGTVGTADHSLTPQQFRDGDIVCFIGDSITHSRKFHSYIYDYYLTRFPRRHIRFVNCGIAGDTAGGAVARLDWDILPRHATVASLMLGMNDVGRGLYGKQEPEAQVLAARAHALQVHQQNMVQLAAILQEHCHPTFIFCTPSPYDETGDIPVENLFGVNGALGQCGDYACELARKYHGGLVDFHGPMIALNVARQRRDPHFTLIGPDRVHPGDVGQMVMAYLYLKAQGVPALVSSVTIDGATSKVTASENATVTNLQAADGGLQFDCLSQALPFPVEETARPALELEPILQNLDQELLSVSLPDPGNYRLTIERQPVGVFSREQLQEGVNLALNPATSQYQQAQEMRHLNERRRGLEVRLRSYAQVKIMLLRAKTDENDDAAVKAYFADFLQKNRTPEGPNPYFKGQFENYLKTRHEIPQLQTEMERLLQTLWEKNQPRRLHYAVTAAGR